MQLSILRSNSVIERLGRLSLSSGEFPQIFSALNGAEPHIGIRHLQAVLLFLAIAVNYIPRLNVSVAVVAMTNAATTNPKFPEYNWTEMQRAYILSSFYWGYIVTQFPAGFLVRRYGVKIVLFIPAFATAVLTLMTPYCISWGGWIAYSVLRIVEGLFQGLIFPCINEHLAKWSPPKDRNLLGVIAFSGCDFGSLMAMFTSGFIANSFMGWPGILYSSSFLCFSWCILWLLLADNNAPSSRLIGQDERDYIESSLKHSDGFHGQQIPVPWRAIWTSAPFAAVMVVRCAQNWANSTMQLQTPAYIHGVLGMDIKQNSLFSALPFAAMWCMSYVFLAFANLAMSRQWMTLTTLRKSLNTLAFWGPAMVFVQIGWLDKEHTSLLIFLLTLNTILNAGACIGSTLAIIDISPNHSAMTMAIINAVSTIFPLASPFYVGFIVIDTSSRSQWQILFSTTAMVLFVGNLVYLIWGSTDVQPWDAEDYQKKPNANNEVNLEPIRNQLNTCSKSEV